MNSDLLEGMDRPCTLLVVLPHPDDESFATGGVLSKYSKDPEVRTVVLCLSKGGESGALDKVGLPAEREPIIREKEFATATAILNVDKAILWEYMDGKLNEVEVEELKERIANVIRDEKADVVITYGPDGITGHPDHKTCSRIVKEACLDESVKRLFMVTAPAWMGKTFLGQELMPITHGIDIRDEYRVKMLALKSHASQMLISMQPMIWVGVIMRIFGKEFYHRVI